MVQSRTLHFLLNPKNQKSPQCAKPVPHVGARLGYKPIIFGIERKRYALTNLCMNISFKSKSLLYFISLVNHLLKLFKTK